MAIIPGGFLSSLGPMLAMLTVVPMGIVFAPQAVRHVDRRIVGLGVAVVLGAGLDIVTKICDWCPWCIECWFL